MNWTLEKKKKITDIISQESKNLGIVHKILSWGENIKALDYIDYKKKAHPFFFADNFLIVLIKYKGNTRHEILYVMEELNPEHLQKFRENFRNTVYKLIDYCENNRNGFAPIQPDEEDLDIIKYICEMVTNEEEYLSINYNKSLYSSDIYDNFIFVFNMKNSKSIFSIHWYELLFHHLPSWEGKMPPDVYDEYKRIQKKYTSVAFKNRFDLKIVTPLKHNIMRTEGLVTLPKEVGAFKNEFGKILEFEDYFDNNFHIGRFKNLSDYHTQIARKEKEEIFLNIPYATLQKLLTYANVEEFSDVVSFQNIYQKVKDRDFNIYFMIRSTTTDSARGELIKMKQEKIDDLSTRFLHDIVQRVSERMEKYGYKVELQ